MTAAAKTRKLPLLPLRDIIVFPHMVVPLFVGREKSINALDEAMAADKEILLSAQKKAKTNEPTAEDIFPVGTLGTIIQLLRLPDGTVKVLVEGKRRARIKRFVQSEGFFQVEAEDLADAEEKGVEIEALMRSIQATFENYAKLNKRIPPEMLVSVQTIDDPARLADTIAAHLSLKLTDKQQILETEAPSKRLERLYELMQAEIEILQVEEKIKNKKMSKEAHTKVRKELKKLKMMSPMSAEATVVRNYIDWVLGLPWEDKTQDNLDVSVAEQVLDEDHYGLKKVKERILEYLAVQALVKKIRGPILCLVGPPGVGKTSLAKSISRSTGRKFVRLSLGGVRDEAEIRGHRRTYIGALPGKIIQSLKKAGSNNPVFLLDEIDKMSTDFRGDPSAALLEVLDPEQNTTFNDHYLDLDYDLSDVMFITTANSLHSIPAPLQDRMEIIVLPGYTEWEKLAIAENYLIPKQKELNGLGGVEIDIAEDAVRHIVHHYTKEAGVRSLEREISTVCRKIAKEVVRQQKATIEPVVTDTAGGAANGNTGAATPVASGNGNGNGDGALTEAPLGTEKRPFRVTAKNIHKYLGVQKFRHGRKEERDEIGLTNGLAVTMHGGDLLTTEVTVLPGKGKLVLTGKLGDVMQESAQAAMSYVRSRAESLGLEREFYQRVDIHVHFPEGAIPKDGPSAGVTIVTSMVSALLRVPVRRDVAMTGEITLRGRVLPIGGLKEKVLAAHRSDVFKVIIPAENKKDLKDIPKRVLKVMDIVAVEHVDDVLRHALALEDAAKFLPGPSASVDWRQTPIKAVTSDTGSSAGDDERGERKPTLNA